MKIAVTRVAQSFVRPSEPTPSGSLSLSTIDLYPGSRDEIIESLHVFKHGQQPAKVIKEALSKALVFYYPLAGRFVDSDHGEVVAIECNGQGVWFVGAIADCALDDVSFLDGVPLMIPKKDLLPYPPPEAEPRDVPMMLQVTEFACGGFVVGFTFIHTVADGIGAAQFMKAIGDFACGNTTIPTVGPNWSRHLIPNPPRFPLGPPPEHFSSTFKLHLSSFHLPIDYINRIKSAYFRKHDRHCTTFEISTATIWQARTRAINIENPKTPVSLGFFANIRHLVAPEVLPREGGYYGNCIYPLFINATSGDIVGSDLVDVVMMIQDAKGRLPEEFTKWSKGKLKADPWVLPTCYNTLYVVDWSNLGFQEVDFGWGKPTHVIPLVMEGYIITVLGRPLVPERGVRLLLQCVEEQHISAFEEHMSGLVLGKQGC